MDVEKSNRTPAAFRQTSRIAFYIILVISAPLSLPIVGVFLVPIIGLAYPIIGVCLGAFAIFSFVRWFNRRDDPVRVKLPVPRPDATPKSE